MFFNEERAKQFPGLALTCEHIKGCVRHYYQNPLLKYHNLDHVNQCVYNYTTFEENPQYNVIVALLYHDIVYFVKNKPGANEEMSSAIFMAHYDADLISKSYQHDEYVIKELIRMTSVKHHLMSDEELIDEVKSDSRLPDNFIDDLKAVLDADLSSMASDYHAFYTNQSNIVYENTAYDYHYVSADEMYKGLCQAAKFLQMFSNKKNIFRTQIAREHYEEKARFNISKFDTFMQQLVNPYSETQFPTKRSST